MSLTCRNVKQLHDAHVDGELGSALNAEVHAHLLQCPECQRQVELLRACGDVVARDESEPGLSADFTARVLASLPTGLETRRVRRHRRIRMFVGGSLPAAAAVVLFCVAIWPPAQSPGRPSVVAPAVVEGLGVSDMVSPTMNALRTIEHANDLVKGEAGKELSRGLSAALNSTTESSGLSILEFLMPSFEEMIELPEPAALPSSDAEVVRF